MNRTLKIYIGIFILLLVGILVNDLSRPKPIDWTPSFLSSHKVPYGTYVLFKELKSFFPNSELKKTNTTAYEYLHNIYDYDLEKYPEKLNYFYINNRLEIDDRSIEELLYFVSQGNNVFMAGNSFPYILSDSLHFRTIYDFAVDQSLSYKFANTKLNNTKFHYEKAVENVYFNELDSLNTIVLGYSLNNTTTHINFIKLKYGEGYFFLNTQPYAFTNYHMLKSDHQVYVSTCLSYLPDYNLLWDDRVKAKNAEIASPLRFILSKPALRWAWYLALLSILIFMIFRAKRRQRIVPIVEKLPNTSIAFARTIGNMYFQEGTPKDIIAQKTIFFLAFIRKTYLLDTQNLNEEFKNRLHLKSGIQKEEIERLIHYIILLSKKETPTETALLNLNKMIDNFYNKTKV